MSERQTNKRFIINLSITVAIWATVMLILLPSCSKKKELAAAVGQDDSIPDMRSTGVTTLISDSGLIRYKIITAEWLVYNQVDTPFWAFEKGIYHGKVRYPISYRRQHKGRHRLLLRNQRNYGNYVATYIYAASAVTNSIPSSLYWDQQKEKIYSDKFIRIEQPDQVLTGYGFESNQQMTEYQIYNNTGVFTVEDTGMPDSTTTK